MKKSLTIMGLFAAFSMFLISCGGPSQKEIDTQARIENERLRIAIINSDNDTMKKETAI